MTTPTPDTARPTPDVLDRLDESLRKQTFGGDPNWVAIPPADLRALLAVARESRPAPTEAQDCTCEDAETCGVCKWDAMALRDDQDEQDAARTAPASEVARWREGPLLDLPTHTVVEVQIDMGDVGPLTRVLYRRFDGTWRDEECFAVGASDLVRPDRWRILAHPNVFEVAATKAEVERAHRMEWADYIDGWDGAVGPEPPTVRSIVAALRRPSPPFGVAAADGAGADA